MSGALYISGSGIDISVSEGGMEKVYLKKMLNGDIRVRASSNPHSKTRHR